MKAVGYIVLLMLAAISPAKPLPAEFLATPDGRRIEQFFTTYNLGDSLAVRRFIAEQYADSALRLRPLEQRVPLYLQRRRDLGELQFEQLLKHDPNQLSLLAQSKSGQWWELTFLFEPRVPRKLMGYMVDQADPPELMNRGPLTQAQLLDSTRRYVSDLTTGDEFSGAVLIARHGEPIFQQAYGMADRERKLPNTVETLFNIGSINKAFTQIAIQQLAAQGKLAPDDVVGKFLPDYPNATVRDRVTVQMLLEHRSGVPDFFNENYRKAARERLRSNADFIPLVAHEPLWFEPGTGQRYSNGGYCLLGAIIEQASGRDYYDYVREHVYQPAGMIRSGHFFKTDAEPFRASGYTLHGDTADLPELTSNFDHLPGRGSAAGGGYSTVADLLAYVNACESGKLPGSQAGPMGIAGGAPGLNAAVETGIGSGFTIVVLANRDPETAMDVALQLRRWAKAVP